MKKILYLRDLIGFIYQLFVVNQIDKAKFNVHW